MPKAPAAKPAPAPAKAPVRKLTPAEIAKMGLKPLPKALPSQVKDDKKPKGYYTLEYTINSSPDVLFDFISSAGGLEKWFAEKVNVKDNLFHFEWENDEMKDAKMIALKEREFARFHWLDQKDNNKFFEFRIQIDDLTSEVALIVSDFADTKEEYEDARLLWNAQIHDLLHALGGAPRCYRWLKKMQRSLFLILYSFFAAELCLSVLIKRISRFFSIASIRPLPIRFLSTIPT